MFHLIFFSFLAPLYIASGQPLYLWKLVFSCPKDVTFQLWKKKLAGLFI